MEPCFDQQCSDSPNPLTNLKWSDEIQEKVKAELTSSGFRAKLAALSRNLNYSSVDDNVSVLSTLLHDAVKKTLY